MVWDTAAPSPRGTAALPLAALLLLLTVPAHAQEIRVATTAATLTIIASPVEHIPTGASAQSLRTAQSLHK
jgi:hypothetical protein